MGLFNFLFANETSEPVSYTDIILSYQAGKLNVKDFGIQKAAGMIAKVIAKAEFQVYRKIGGKVEPVKDDTYYWLNIRPNPNENGTTFWYRVVHKLLTTGEALVVDVGKDHYLADSFTPGKSVTNGVRFSDVKIGDLPFNKTFKMDDCLYFTLGENKISDYLNTYYSEIGTMLALAAKDYRVKNSRKHRLHVPTNTMVKSGETGKTLNSQEYADMIARQLENDEKTVVSLEAGVSLETISGNEIKTSQDFRDMLRTALESAAMAYDIPLDIFFGNKTEKSTSIRDFITFACDWIFEMIEDELNAKWLTKKEYLDGSKIKADKSKVQHIDFFDTADAEYKLIGCGYSPDEIRIAKGLEPLNETWSKEHYFTKNNEKGGGNG